MQIKLCTHMVCKLIEFEFQMICRAHSAFWGEKCYGRKFSKIQFVFWLFTPFSPFSLCLAHKIEFCNFHSGQFWGVIWKFSFALENGWFCQCIQTDIWWQQGVDIYTTTPPTASTSHWWKIFLSHCDRVKSLWDKIGF